ncbi:vegetative cell wall protein gp1-like isoform X1 [Choloepus didactylus]|uniref:vegetative cell wall protein gp1-like isoform X1 n=1 Tax=Choloepus didactylus TaxID=27675 RepID=UPI0018A104DD|nr:vegetative cell wall protein gp1-like isoform X1 [Choloepus didactylus]XP_037704219.1 vegetative cell wall protein gp1-like isoform X1 [Choloepus didactylus]XP_037704221.1 vegetative cell wall protein gp1-like isoform X1 [Choloepus didactylus]XP_037704222.1 vegetative cell wall protein gp1-like isoform X1 [Choloepus didactylus]
MPGPPALSRLLPRQWPLGWPEWAVEGLLGLGQDGRAREGESRMGGPHPLICRKHLGCMRIGFPAARPWAEEARASCPSSVSTVFLPGLSPLPRRLRPHLPTHPCSHLPGPPLPRGRLTQPSLSPGPPWWNHKNLDLPSAPALCFSPTVAGCPPAPSLPCCPGETRCPHSSPGRGPWTFWRKPQFSACWLSTLTVSSSAGPHTAQVTQEPLLSSDTPQMRSVPSADPPDPPSQAGHLLPHGSPLPARPRHPCSPVSVPSGESEQEPTAPPPFSPSFPSGSFLTHILHHTPTRRHQQAPSIWGASVGRVPRTEPGWDGANGTPGQTPAPSLAAAAPPPLSAPVQPPHHLPISSPTP